MQGLKWYSLINIKNNLTRRLVLIVSIIPVFCIVLPIAIFSSILDFFQCMIEAITECWRGLDYYNP